MVRAFNKAEKLLEKKYIILAVLAAAGLIVYANSFFASFHLDDNGSIVSNYAIRNPLDLAAIWKFYSNRFIIYLSFSINYVIHRDWETGYHIVNVAIHIFNGFIFYLILNSLLSLKYFTGKKVATYKRIISAIAAIIFITHPLQVNAVTYIVQRTASLAATFYMLAIYYFIKFRVYDKIRHFIFVLIFTVIAMFTKENTITIPFMLLLIELLFFLNDGKTTWKKRLLFLFVLFLTVPIIPGTDLLLHGYSQSDPSVSFKASTSMNRMQYFYTELNVIILYIKLLFIPDKQNFDYSNDFPFSHTIWENYSYISFIIIAIIIIFGMLNFKKNKLVALGILWFFMGLAVESSFISIKDVYFEHRLYYPIAGFVIAIIGIIFGEYKLGGRKTLFEKPLLFFLVFSVAFVVFNSALTLRRNYIYSDEVRLWADVVEKAPRNDRAHSCLGGSYLDKYNTNDKSTFKYLALSEKELKKAIELNDYNDTAHCNLGKVYLLEGKYDDCIKESIKTNNQSPSVYAYNNMGQAYEKKGDFSNALSAFLSGYRKDNKFTFILEDLGNVYFEMKDYTNSKKYFDEYKQVSYYRNKNAEDKLEQIKKLESVTTVSTK
ncbi:MAG: hypothetical protein Q8920_05320 [Bacillota bacterium]|nr:hypothetical protein [Bacillota bacterium]